MSKKDFAIIEINTDGFKVLKEIAIITVSAITASITSVNYILIDDGSYTVKEAMDITLKLINGKKLVSHTGLDFEMTYLNRILKETHNLDNPLNRLNTIDTHVLAMKYLYGIPKDMKSVAKHFNIHMENDNALSKATTTYWIIKNMFSNKSIRQHTYKYSPNAIMLPVLETVKKVTVTTEIICNTL